MTFKKAIWISIFCFVGCEVKDKNAYSQQDLISDLNFLTDPLLDGRKVGTWGEDIAALYLKTKFEALNYSVKVASFSIQECRFQLKIPINGKNVIAFLDGSDAKKETIILSAHYDGVGRKEDNLFHPAADDNASGTVALLALAKMIKKRNWNKDILLIAFGGEEAGLCGSIAYVRDVSTENFKVNLNLDMVGRPMIFSAPAVFLTGDDDRANEIVQFFKKASKNSGLEVLVGSDLKEQPWWRWRSDHYSFHESGVLGLMLTDGNPGGNEKQRYFIHTPNDSKDKINFQYLEQVVNLVFKVLIELDK